MNDSFRESQSCRTARHVPEIQTCKANRDKIQRYLVHSRNAIDGKLQRLNCPQPAHQLLLSWLDALELNLSDPGGLATSLFDADLEPEEFNELWDTIDSIARVAGSLPETATEYLEAVAPQANAGKLALFYWAHLHYPLRDRFDELAASVRQLLGIDQLVRRRKEALIRQNAEASRNAITVYSCETMDLHGDSFGWTLFLYRMDTRFIAETHQWTECGEAHDPSINDIDSGMDLADLLKAGEGDGIWQIDAVGYRKAVERVFDFDAALGIDFLDALHHEYEVDIGQIGRPDLRAAWAKYLEAINAESGEESVAGDSRTTSGPPISGQDRRSIPRELADPIATALNEIEIQPAEASGMWGGYIRARARGKRRWAARAYAIHYAQKHLQLPTGRHNISKDGRPGDDFWAEFPEQSKSTDG